MGNQRELEQQYAVAAAQVQAIFRSDVSLVRGPFNIGVAGQQELVPGCYNALLPDAGIIPSDVAALAIHCMDKRSSEPAGKQIQEAMGGSVMHVTVGGGGAQPGELGKPRQQTVVGLGLAFHALNPEASIVLGCHRGKCGGCEYCTKGVMSRVINQLGTEGEITAMNHFVLATAFALNAAGVPAENIRIVRADVDPETNLFAGLAWIK